MYAPGMLSPDRGRLGDDALTVVEGDKTVHHLALVSHDRLARSSQDTHQTPEHDTSRPQLIVPLVPARVAQQRQTGKIDSQGDATTYDK
jgi:hypothetical protein